MATSSPLPRPLWGDELVRREVCLELVAAAFTAGYRAAVDDLAAAIAEPAARRRRARVALGRLIGLELR